MAEVHEPGLEGCVRFAKHLSFILEAVGSLYKF